MSSAQKSTMVRRRKGGTAIVNDDIALEMERLFDHYNMDHIPVDKHLDGFKQRDLPLVKHYKAAVNIFGGPISRKRVIIAPPMETPFKMRLGQYMNQPQYPSPPTLNNPVKMPAPRPKVFSSEEILDQEEKEKVKNYKEWYAKRQQLRTNLERMGPNEEYLQRKADKSELEKRVQHRMKEVRTRRPPSPPQPEPILQEKEPPVVPNVKVPVPTALQTLDRFLAEKKMRLIDLFRKADRNNDWKLSKEELQAAVKKYNIPLRGSDIEDLLVVLDTNFDELLDFREIAKGLAALKTERRASKRLESAKNGVKLEPQLSPLSTISPLSRDQLNFNQNSTAGTVSQGQSELTQPLVDYFTAADIDGVDNNNSNHQEGPNDSDTSTRSVSAQLSRSSTPNSLERPPADLRKEQRVYSSPEEMVELRKHDKVVLERTRKKKWPWKKNKKQVLMDETPGVIRIGHKAVDQHCLMSTLEGDTGFLMDEFRRMTLKEYFKAMRSFEDKGVVLNEGLLDRVLLYPPELPRFECMKHLAIPKGPLAELSEHFAEPPKPPKPPPVIQHKDKIQVSSDGTVMIDTRHHYPPFTSIAPVVVKENLSTGSAMIQRKSDIWMSFEEYSKHTKDKAAQSSAASKSAQFQPEDLPKRYKKLKKQLRPGSVGREHSPGFTGYTRYQLDQDKFWPGYMLHKLVQYEPGASQGWGQRGKSSVFQTTGSTGRPGNLGKVKVTGPPVQSDGYRGLWH